MELADRLHEARDWIDDTFPERPREESLSSYEEFSKQIADIAIGAIERLAAHLETEPDDEAARRIYARLLESV